MSRSDQLRRAFEHNAAQGRVPLWEIHFHLWSKYSLGRFVSGNAFLALPEMARRDAIKRDADVIVELAERFEFNGVSIPDAPWDCVYTLPQQYRLELVRELRDRKGDFLIIASSGAYLGMPDSSDDYLQFCYMMMDEPEAVDRLAESTFREGMKRLEEMIDAGVDAVYSGADQADNRGPFYSPEQMDRWIWGYQRKWAERAAVRGIYAIMHSDGNVMPLLDRIAENRVVALQALDPIAGMDMARAFDKVEGRLCLCGNIDCGLMVSGTPACVYKMTSDLIRRQRHRKGFVLGSSNAVVWETPLENYDAFLAAWRET